MTSGTNIKIKNEGQCIFVDIDEHARLHAMDADNQSNIPVPVTVKVIFRLIRDPFELT